MKKWIFKIGEREYTATGITWDIAFSEFNRINGFKFTMKYVIIKDCEYLKQAD